ncbi:MULTISPECIES: sigma-54 interaction domain-containing protein [Paraburkholderia]|uniref:Sigma 54-interacting transcriptional regulator n=1 Tax=Paraburkholderia madseniana TaxID=2599607 RepID=A0AAP5B6K6_9BURK|nr:MULTISPECIES: sigma 54-interacting transcriptional regulator [Paraburkholderia]MCX4144052.1 sigma 54-interacting transcriptional regulator [Paraburkholderia madseniana]MCX4170846.1 sigma 54-interacting transcriptional regulator [Paraburkholderia madseniana]MDN7147006.1 sigma 54-interacting transcriptional regulator [Paraburkholderia sp. WS6]MDQ6405886.1 sigma 54-interacting transcriptional regulator [Paraburkholderia madseniana]MDQ6458858.1 sigma 54-interacting transcriptional regulator [Pa
MMNDWAGLPATYGDVLRRAMDSLFRTFENFSEGTFIVDAEARVVWINKRYAARFGFSDPEQAIGRDCEEVIPNSLMREVVKTGKPILLDILETGREPLVVTRLPLKDDAGETVGAVGFALFDELKALTPLFSHYSRVQEELIATRQSLAQARRAKYTFGSFVGTSAASLEVKRQARRAAQLESPVLLLGETGTGKELLAHAIHGGSARANWPLVTVNVAAIPDTLLEVEFFGAAPGAYTGADRKGRVGKFELANGGTLFLDEIGDMPLPLQGKLLRVLQDREFEPLGSNRIVRADVRIIAATSADLPALVAAGRFRADLFYRLNVLTIQAPALRERSSDIEALAYAMLEDLSTQARGASHFELQDDALRLLCSYGWPGNVRELRNTLERAVMLSDSERIDARALAPFIGPAQGGHRLLVSTGSEAHASDATSEAPEVTSWSDAMATFEKRFLGDALRANGGRVIETAMQIGMGRATLYKKIAAYGIEV